MHLSGQGYGTGLCSNYDMINRSENYQQIAQNYPRRDIPLANPSFLLLRLPFVDFFFLGEGVAQSW